MAIANVAITDTFETWRTRFNTVIDTLNLVTGGTGAAGTLSANNITAVQSLTATAANVNLGALSTVTITGGVNGQYIQTDGAGNLTFVDQGGANGFSDLSGTIANSQYAAVHAPAVGTWTQSANTTFSANVNLGAIADVHITGGVNGNWVQTDGTGGLSFANVNFTNLEGTISNSQYPSVHAPIVTTWIQAAATILNGTINANGVSTFNKDATFNQNANFTNDAVFTGNANFMAAQTKLAGANTNYIGSHYPDALVTLGSVQNNLTINMANGNFFTMTANGTFTVQNPTNVNPGMCGAIFITQDVNGNSVVSWGDAWQFQSNTAPTLTATAGAVDRVDFVALSSNAIHAVASLDYQ